MKKRARLLILFGVLLIGCTGQSSTSNKITLTMWEDDTNIEMLEVLAEEFSAWYANSFPKAAPVEVKFIPESEGKSISNLQNDGPAGNGPDIVAFVHDTLGTAVSHDLLSPVIFSEEIRQENEEHAIQAFTMNNTLFAYPYVAESLTLMYDKTQLTALDVVSFSSLLASGKKIALTMTGDGSGYYPFGLFTDSLLFGEDGTNPRALNFSNEETVNNLYEVYHTYASIIEDVEPNTALTLLETKQIAGIISAPYLWVSVKENLGAKASIAKLPTINGLSQRPFSGFKGYGVSKHSKNPAIAHLLAKYFSSEDSQYYRYMTKGYLPTYLGSSRIEEAISNNEVSSVFYASLEDSIPMPNIIQMGNYWAPMQDTLTYLWNNRATLTKEQIISQLNIAKENILD